MKRALLLTGSLLVSSAPLASSQEEAAAQKVASGFVELAGGEDNSLALAGALREGIAVRLDYPARVIVIDPPTGRMSWNDVRMALTLARDALQRYGISQPCGEELEAVLLGGEIVTPNGKAVTFGGILRMRAGGMNWGGIAAERYRLPRAARQHASL
jgi:hypothetical protein